MTAWAIACVACCRALDDNFGIRFFVFGDAGEKTFEDILSHEVVDGIFDDLELQLFDDDMRGIEHSEADGRRLRDGFGNHPGQRQLTMDVGEGGE